MLIFASLFFALASSYDRLSYQDANGDYKDANYLTTHEINPSSITSTGDQDGHSIEFALKDDDNYWVSNRPNSNEFHNAINITFPEKVPIEAFLYDVSYRTIDGDNHIVEFHGVPTKLKVYTSNDENDDFVLHSIFNGVPEYPLVRAQFVFRTPANCKKLMIEFIDVTDNEYFSNGEKTVAIKYIKFLKKLDFFDQKYEQVSGNYGSSPYVDFHQLIPGTHFDYESEGDYNDYSIDHAFDNSEDSFWISNSLVNGNSKSYIIINFKQPTLFEGFLIKGDYYSRLFTDYYPGCPTQLNLLAKNNTDSDYTLHAKFSGSPSGKKDTYQFIPAGKVLCDSIKIEFVDVVEDKKHSKSKRVLIDKLTLFRSFENEGLETHGVTGVYADANYLSTHEVPSSDYTLSPTGGFQSGHEIESATKDDDVTTYWVSEKPNSDDFHNCVLVDFNHFVLLEAVLFYPVYKTEKNQKSFSGFPKIFKIYSSLNDDEDFKLVATYFGIPDNDNIRFQYVFPNTVNCTKIKLEFVEVTPFTFNNDGSLYAGVDKLVFVQKTEYDYLEYHKNTGYSESRVIPKSKFTYSSTAHKDSHIVDNLFDEDDSNYWESGFQNSDSNRASIFINFTQQLKLEEFLVGAYIGTFDGYFGYPTKLNVYASENDDEPLKLRATFVGDPDSGNFFQFTLREPFICTRLQIEFIDINYNLLHEGGKPYAAISYIKFIGEMIEFSTGDLNDDFYTQHVNKSYPLNGVNDTYFVIKDLPDDDEYLFVVEKQFYFNNISFSCPEALMSAIKSNHSNKVTVAQCQFNKCSVKSNIGNGGAILILNSVLTCDDSSFENCHSKANGGGGGICIFLNENVNEEVAITNCTFSECSATYGGAVYLYSNIVQNKIIVQNCTFKSNSLIDSSSSESSLVGGSGIYLHAKNSKTKKCKFYKNSGSAIIIDNDYDNVQTSLLKSFFKASVLIDDCVFEIDSSSKSSISYVHLTKKAVITQVSNCIFSGKLVDGAHHIVINSSEIRNPKLNIKSCKFTCDKSKSINLNLDDHNALNSIVSFDVNNQQFNYDSKNHENEKSNSKSLFSLSVSLIVVAVIASIAIIIVFVMRKSVDDESNDNKDPLNCPLNATDL